MTKTIEIRSLVSGENKEITISNEIEQAFKDWKEKRAGDKIKPIEIFYAGYVLANPMVRDLFKIKIHKEKK